MRIRFGNFILDTGTREIVRGRKPVHLSKKAFDLLDILVASAPDALSKKDLYERLWGETIVEEVNLSNLISEVRGALGESAKEARFVRTVHGFGYAFSGEHLAEDSGRVRGAQAAHVCSLFWHRDEFPIREGRSVIGRSDEADITLDSASISRQHARVTVRGLHATIEDLGSKNGTFVRGERVRGATEIHDGDEIRLGKVSIVFRMIRRVGSTVTCTPTE